MKLTIFKYQDSEVTFDPSARMWSLNAMHLATGANRHKAPAEWLRQVQTQELIAALSTELDTGDARIGSVYVETRRGGSDGGGTWACPELALAYAHYLRPDFYIACNRWMLGQTAPRTRRALPGVVTPETQEVVNAISLDVTSTADIRARLPHVALNTLHQRLFKMRQRGQVVRVGYGRYSLKTA